MLAIVRAVVFRVIVNLPFCSVLVVDVGWVACLSVVGALARALDSAVGQEGTVKRCVCSYYIDIIQYLDFCENSGNVKFFYQNMSAVLQLLYVYFLFVRIGVVQ